MPSAETHSALAAIFSELVWGAHAPDGAYALNTGDAGLLQSLDRLSPREASRSSQDGATIAAHAEHVRFGLSLMNRWADDGGDPFTNAKWDDAWKTSTVDTERWEEIRRGLREECDRWASVLTAPREMTMVELKSMLASVAHLAYHLGAIRQIEKTARGPRETATGPG